MYVLFSSSSQPASAATAITNLHSIATFENAAASGDLDIEDSLTITGNNQTVISTTYTSACGDCKVFAVVETILNGHSAEAYSETGGAVLSNAKDLTVTAGAGVGCADDRLIIAGDCYAVIDIKVAVRGVVLKGAAARNGQRRVYTGVEHNRIRPGVGVGIDDGLSKATVTDQTTIGCRVI